MKILIAYHYFPHYRRPVLRALAAQSELDVTFLTGVNTGPVNIEILAPQELNRIGGSENIVVKAKNKWFFKLALWQSHIIPQVLYTKYDVVIFLGDFRVLSYYVALIFCRLRNTKTLLWTHGLRKTESGFRWSIRRMFYNLSDGLLLYGHKAKDYLSSSGLGELPLFVIGNSLNYPLQKSLRKRPSVTHLVCEDYTVVFIGRVEAEKNMTLFLEAAQLLKDEGYSFKIIGGGTGLLDLAQNIEKRSLTNVHLLGPIYEETKIAEVLNTSDACAIPGPAGLSVIHSLSYGVPVVVHDNFQVHGPEVEAVVDGKTGVFFKANDSGDLADKIRTAVKLRRSGFDDCVAAVESGFTPDAQTKAIMSALYNVTSER